MIGGEKSGVTDSTTSIILEAATYNQASVRRTTLRHDLRTEASTRLEKFLHPRLTELALLRAADLIRELCGGEVVGHYDAYPQVRGNQTITLTQDYLQKISGVELSLCQAQELLAKIYIPSKELSADSLEVEVPYFRTDLEQEADIVEEVIRMYGYDNLPSHLPSSPTPKSIQSAAYDLGEKVRDIMISVGYDEQITEPLTNEENPVHEPVRLENSLTSEKVMLRTTLVPMLLRGLDYRKKHRQSVVKIFEVGKVYEKVGDQYTERHTFGLLASGKDMSYREVKGVIETLFVRLGYDYNPELFTIEAIEATDPTYVVQLDLQGLLNQEKTERVMVVTSPPQVVLQDLSLLLPRKVAVGELLQDIRLV